MTEDRMRLRAIALLRDHLDVEGEITDATTLDQLNADSLDRIEAGMALEEEFGLTIDDADVPDLTTVRELVQYLAENV